MLTADPKNRDRLATAALAEKLTDLVHHAAATGNRKVIGAAIEVVAATSTMVENLPAAMADIFAEYTRENETLRRAKPIGKTS